MTTKHTLQDEFTKWFTANYPPNCVISRPEWHAPKIWRAARVPDLLAENERLRATLAGFEAALMPVDTALGPLGQDAWPAIANAIIAARAALADGGQS